VVEVSIVTKSIFDTQLVSAVYTRTLYLGKWLYIVWLIEVRVNASQYILCEFDVACKYINRMEWIYLEVACYSLLRGLLLVSVFAPHAYPLI